MYRGRGLATVATSAVTADLLRECGSVLLTVETINGSAIRVYEKLGYQGQCTLYETPAIRKEPLGAFALARRLLARWRGRRQGKELVIR
jgi:ribosomal protein S18 acetylase RimI-like enzyme